MISAIPVPKPTESTHHRLFEFAKTARIKIFVSPYATVCDLYCSGVPDEDKWDEAQIGHYIAIDVAQSGISQVQEAWESQQKAYTSEFFELDPCIEDMESRLQDKGNMADIVCCMQHLQWCFETEEKGMQDGQEVGFYEDSEPVIDGDSGKNIVRIISKTGWPQNAKNPSSSACTGSARCSSDGSLRVESGASRRSWIRKIPGLIRLSVGVRRGHLSLDEEDELY